MPSFVLAVTEFASVTWAGMPRGGLVLFGLVPFAQSQQYQNRKSEAGVPQKSSMVATVSVDTRNGTAKVTEKDV
ncbi:hypothetical protein B0J18DRAFT_440692 [Chaetomium sp. MPI-SDFR-AT-0129]|nr:hypothetical protein B0J18DRAFT_440692 [Chaetomium sp. MPI-SDFR-AT-0129]